MNRISSFGYSTKWRRQLLQQFPIGIEPKRTLDIFSGIGETWRHIKNRFPGTEITAIDFSPGMVLQARDNNRLHFNGDVTVIEGDVLNTELPPGNYDLVVCAFGLKSLPPAQVVGVAKLTEQVLAPGGHFAFLEVSIPPGRLMKMLFSFHIRWIVPAVGLLFGRREEFRMLWRYTSAYGNSKEVAEAFKALGLEVVYDSYFFGCATGFHGRKRRQV